MPTASSEELIRQDLPATGSAWPGALLLAAVFLLTAGWNFWSQPIENPDEPRYACPAREMARGGDWLVPYFNGQPRLVKPVLLYWALALAGKAGTACGLEWATAFRIVPLLCGLCSVLAVYGLGRRLCAPRAGLLAGLVLATTWYFHEISREILIDPLLTTLVAGAWYFFVRALDDIGCSWQPGQDARAAKREPRTFKRVRLAALYLCLGLACLAKGPVLVAAFCVLPMLAFLVWERRRILGESGVGELARRAGLVWGVPLALLVGFSWFIALAAHGYGGDVWRFFIEQNLKRGAGQVDHNSGIRMYPFIYYLGDLAANFQPWAPLLLVLACAWGLVRWRAASAQRGGLESAGRRGGLGPAGWGSGLGPAGRLLLCMTVIPFVILGLAASKRSLYMLPLYPALALTLGVAWERIGLVTTSAPAFGSRAPQRAWSAVLSLIAVVLAIGGVCLPLALQRNWLVAHGAAPATPGESSVGGALGLGLAVSGALAVRDLWGGRAWRGGLQVLAACAVFLLGYEAIVRPELQREARREEFHAELAAHLRGRPLAWFGGSANEAAWYLDQTVRPIRRVNSLKEGFFARPDAVLLVRGKEMEKYGWLRAAVRGLGQFTCGGETFYLVEADPAHPPDEAQFGAPKPETETED